MKKIIVAALAATAGIVGTAGAVEAKPEKPNTTCMQFGMGVLQSFGILDDVARDGLAFPIGSETVYSLNEVIAIHRNDPATANVVLKAYAPILFGGEVPAEVVAAVDAACPS